MSECSCNRLQLELDVFEPYSSRDRMKFLLCCFVCLSVIVNKVYGASHYHTLQFMLHERVCRAAQILQECSNDLLEHGWFTIYNSSLFHQRGSQYAFETSHKSALTSF